MGTQFRWGVLGPGRIANRFATDLQNLPDASLVAVASRSSERAAEFAHKFGATRTYDNYLALVDDPEVDAIYVSTPHPFHREHTMLCLEHGKPVLCEKPMSINEAQVRQMVDCARTNRVFLMEAMWTRFLPVIRQVKAWIDEKRIGEPRILTADFGFRTGWDPKGRLLNPELAGGATLDVGVYVMALASLVFGKLPAQIQARAHIGETGVDEQTAMLLHYADGALAMLSCAVRTNTPQEARICGSEGSIYIPAFWHAISATLQVSGQEPVQTSGQMGFQFEIAEVMSCVREGRQESSLLPLDESITIARALEQVRTSIGLTYPMECAVQP